MFVSSKQSAKMMVLILYLLCVMVSITNSMVFNSSLLQSKMIGGQKVRGIEFRFVVSLRIEKMHFCGGYLVSNHHIITVAQCVLYLEEHGGDNYESASALVGTLDSRDGTDYHIENTDYVDEENSNHPAISKMLSIGMILLAGPFLDMNHSPVCTSFNQISLYGNYQLLGWGEKNSRDSMQPSYFVLRAMDITMRYVSDCNFILGPGVFSTYVACGYATQRGGSVDEKDLGSPLLLIDHLHRLTLAGIVCGGTGISKDDPVFFIRTILYESYIEHTMQGKLNPVGNNDHIQRRQYHQTNY